jgi:molybdate transport system substrate-binding protein
MNLKFRLALILLSVFHGLHAQDRIVIAAASDLKFALDSVIKSYNLENIGTIETTYGSSGKLSEQIIHGAPFDLFFSADISYPELIRKESKTGSNIYQYARGRLVIWSKKIDPNQKEMKSLLEPSIKKIAIANPMHAPYGMRAIESLEYHKLMHSVKGNLVYGENISQAAQFVSTGAADIGIIALSVALSPNMQRENGRYYLIPEASHQPLNQGVVITSHGKSNKLAKAFFEFVKTEKAIEVFKHYGFSTPE